MARLYKRSRQRVDVTGPDKLCFLLNDELIELEQFDPRLTVLEFIRNHKGLTGTKSGCAQGECGCCTVTVGEIHGASMHYQSVNSCICPVASLHGRHLITVEGLGRDGKLHPAQQSLLSSHATQCGFCTPGMVMTLNTLCYHRDKKLTGRDLTDTINGNLCRCTGYRSVIAAARKTLRRKNLPSFGYDPRQVLGKLKKTPYKSTQTFTYKNTTYHSPVTSDEAAQLILKYPEATILAGATGIRVQEQGKRARPVRTISLERVQALKLIRKGKDMFAFGAGVTLSDFGTAVDGDYPDLSELVRRFGPRQIRNRATVIGNIATAAPNSEIAAALIVLNAKLTLRVGNYRRFIKLEDFYMADGKQDIKPGEFIESMTIPRVKRSTFYHVFKLSTRYDHDCPLLCGAFFLSLDPENRVREIRICFSGMDVVPARAIQTERSLVQEPWTLASVNNVIAFFDSDFEPRSDGDGSAAYRMIAAKNLVRRFYLETQSESIPTRLNRGRNG